MAENGTKARAALELLKSFNRKERYHLLRKAVVGGPFHLTDEFRASLANAVGLESIPDESYVAMDYHFDWIAAALYLADQYGEESLSGFPHRADWHVSDNFELPNTFETANEGEKSNVINGNQEDVDLLVAYTRSGLLHLLLVEAKVESGWDGDQLVSKGKRVAEIFGGTEKEDEKEKFSFVDARFVLAGPPRKDGNPPAFDDEKMEDLPAPMFHDPENRKAKNLYRMELVAAHSLYQPTRVSEKGNKEYKRWKVTRSFASNAQS